MSDEEDVKARRQLGRIIEANEAGYERAEHGVRVSKAAALTGVVVSTAGALANAALAHEPAAKDTRSPYANEQVLTAPLADQAADAGKTLAIGGALLTAGAAAAGLAASARRDQASKIRGVYCGRDDEDRTEPPKGGRGRS